jgi:hypothetical protein
MQIDENGFENLLMNMMFKKKLKKDLDSKIHLFVSLCFGTGKTYFNLELFK